MKPSLTLGIAAVGLAAVGTGFALRAASPDAPDAKTTTAAAPKDAQVGQPAPPFALPDQDGKTRSLASYKGKPVVLAFYPADMTGGCSLQARSLTKSLPDFEKRGVQVFGVSTQGVASKKQFCERDGITYPLLADEQKTASRDYGVLNGNLARRVTFLIAPDGTVADVIKDVQVASHGSQVLARLDALKLQATDAAPEKAEVGKAIAPFTLPDYNGKATTVGEWDKSKATVLLWVSVQCPVSNDYNSRMQALASDYAAKGVRVVGINSNKAETNEAIAAHAKQNGFAFPVLKDTGNKIADQLQASVTPEAYVVDSQGVLRYWGRVDDSRNEANVKTRDLRAALDAMLASKPVPAAKTSAFGCTIKRVQS